MNDIQYRALQKKLEKSEDKNKSLRKNIASLKSDARMLNKDLKDIRRLINNMPLATILVQQGNIIFMNEIARDVLGYKEQEIENLDYLNLVHPEFVEMAKDIHQRRLLKKSAPDQYEIRLITKGGEPLQCEIKVKRIIYKGQTAFLGNASLLDKRKQAEMKVRQRVKIEGFINFASALNNEFAHFYNILNEYPIKLQSKTSYGNKNLNEWQDKLEIAKQRANFISQQLQRLIKPKNLPPEISIFNLNHIVQNAIELTRPRWEKAAERNGITINVKSYLRSLSPVEGNSQEIQDVFEYLIINAIEALPEGGDIYLTVEENHGFANVYIQDNGTGIPKNIKDKIFDPFFSTKDNERLGLGLSLAYAAVNRHNGEIEVMGLEGQGATFIIKLPLKMKDSLPKTHVIRKNLNNCHVILVTAEDMVNTLLHQLFSSKGCRVSAVSTNGEAIKLLKKYKIDLIISNLMMSYTQSSVFIKKVREICKDLPIFLINSNEKATSNAALKNLGFDLITGKPLEMTKILSLACKVLDAR